MVSSTLTVSNGNSNNYTVNKTILKTAAVIIGVVIVVNIVLRSQFLFNHYIQMFHCFDIIHV